MEFKAKKSSKTLFEFALSTHIIFKKIEKHYQHIETNMKTLIVA